MELHTDWLLAVALGLGLAAASGLRVFVPLLALSLASSFGYVHVGPGWEWLATRAAMIAFGTATILEVVAFAVPWLDHALDVVASPAAVVAGILASASVLVDMPPLLKWSIAIIGGGGMAGLTQGASVIARLKSGLFTGGLANPLVAITELIGAVLLSAMAVFVPIAACGCALVLVLWAFRRRARTGAGRATTSRPR